MNSNSTTKSPRLGPGLRLSKVCRLLFLAVLIKLFVLGSLFMDMPFFSPEAVVAQPAVAEVPAVTADSSAQNDAQSATLLAQTPQADAAPRPALGTGEAQAAEPIPAEAQTPYSPPAGPVTSESLLRRQAELNQQEQDLLALERQIDLKLTELQAVERRIQAMLEEADATRDEKLKHLVDVYTNMKARQAAEALETLDERIAVKILANMRGRQAGEILNFVTPAKAARLSEQLTRVQMPLDY